MTPSTVKLTFSGLLVLHAKDGAPHCDVRVPRRVPHHHDPVMNVAVRTGLGAITLVSLGREDFRNTVFRLLVENCPQSDAVTLMHGGHFSRRHDVGHENDFRWAVDFEGELYRREIGHVKGGWLSWLRVGGGHFYTDRKSEDDLVTYLKDSGEEERHGRVAVRIGAHVDLDGPGSRVVLQKRRVNESAWSDVFTCLPVPGVHYEIHLSQTMPPGMPSHPGEEQHADFYYYAVGSRLSEKEKKFFKSSRGAGLDGSIEGRPKIFAPEILIDPRAICFVAEMSKTEGDDGLFADSPTVVEPNEVDQHDHGSGHGGDSGGEQADAHG